MKSDLKTISRQFALFALAIASAMAASSCRSAGDTSPVAPAKVQSAVLASSRHPMAHHWIQDQKLRTLMAELLKRNPAWPAGLPQEPESPVAATQPFEFNEVAALANQLADAADHLPGVIEHLTMSEADRAGFLAEARTLREQAVQLQSAANRRRIEQMQHQMDGINATCISCHSRYRDFSGNYFQPQASAVR